MEKLENLEEQTSDHFFSDISDIVSENSSSSLFSTVDEVFDDVFDETYEEEFDNHYHQTKKEKYNNINYQNNNKKKYNFFENSSTNHNIYNRMITKKVHYDTVTCLSAYDSFLISGSLDETIQIINTENNLEIVQTYDDFDSPVRYVQMRNKLVLTQSDSFKLFDIRKPKKGVLSTNLQHLSQIKGFINSSYENIHQKNIRNLNNHDGILLQGTQFNNKKNKWNNFNYNFNSNFQKHLYDEEIIKMNYITPQYLFEKKIKINNYFLSQAGKNAFNNIIYSNMINDYTIVCIDRNRNSYFYDIRNEKWINRFMQNKQKKKNIIIAAASDKQQICTVDSVGDIILEQLNFWTSTNFYQKRKPIELEKIRLEVNKQEKNNDDEKENWEQDINGDSWKMNIFENKSAISCSYINFLNYKNEPDSLSNILLFTNKKGNLEIMKKKEL